MYYDNNKSLNDFERLLSVKNNIVNLTKNNPSSYFERLVSVKNNIVNLINNKSLNYFERLVSVKNNIVDSIKNNNNHRHDITLLADNFRVFIRENAY